MGNKYLDTKEGSLEQSILGLWQTAIDESDARVDGRTKQYKEHRAKLETARQRREEKKLNKEEVELTEKVDKKLANATLSMKKNQKFVKGSSDFVPKIYLSKDSLDVLKKRFGKLPREFPSPNTGMEVVSLINFALGSKDGRGPYDTEDGNSNSPKLYNNDRGKVVGKFELPSSVSYGPRPSLLPSAKLINETTSIPVFGLGNSLGSLPNRFLSTSKESLLR
jgi:hypothetical protein